MKDAKDREIRDILLGRTKLLPDGRMAALTDEDRMVPIGVVDGASLVRVFGVSKRSKVIETTFSRKHVLQDAKLCLRNIGRMLELSEPPETAACFVRYYLTRPVVVTIRFEEEQEKPEATVYTARSLLCFLSLLRAMKDIEKALPKGMAFPEKKKKESER